MAAPCHLSPKGADVTDVCMESTSVYWMPVWRVLENYIPKLMLVNPFQAEYCNYIIRAEGPLGEINRELHH